MTDTTTTMTVRLSKQLKSKLERLAVSTRRSKSYLAAEAIAEYVDLNAWQVEEIRKAVEKADAGGPFVRDPDASRYLDALARGESPSGPGPSGHASCRWRSAGSRTRSRTSPGSTVTSRPMVQELRRVSWSASRQRSACSPSCRTAAVPAAGPGYAS